jgi:hypothetical protein
VTALAHGGVSIDLPDRWDGQIRQHASTGAARTTSTAAEESIEETATLLHAASFALPAERGDYGSGAVEVMGGSDILICLLEHERAAADTALFAHHGVPEVAPAGFSPQSMQRAIAGMCGYQQFFQVAGRPFCLYVVVGSWVTRAPLVRTAARVVGSLEITP